MNQCPCFVSGRFVMLDLEKSFKINVISSNLLSESRVSSSWTWDPIGVLFCQKATRFCLKRGAFSWRVGSSSAPWHSVTPTQMLRLTCWKSWNPDSAGSILGLPHFSVEPQHMSIVANVSLSLSCVAHGPPEPVRVIWLQDGAPLNSLTDPVALSPSTLNLKGIFFLSLISAGKRTLHSFSDPWKYTQSVSTSSTHSLSVQMGCVIIESLDIHPLIFN